MSVITPIDAPTDYYPANLVSLEELKVLLSIDAAGRSEDAYLAVAIAGASAAITRYTERDFGAPAIREERTFQFDGAGVLDIDDCTNVTRVVLAIPNSTDLEIPSDSWSAQPPVRFEQPVHSYLLLPSVGGVPILSPQMGFTSNLDRYYRDYSGWGLPTSIKVTATWGWPDVPVDVKQAVAWTVDDWRTRSGEGESLAAHSIEGFSESWQRGAGTNTRAMAIPDRARDILSAYERHEV